MLHAEGCFIIPNPWDVGSAGYLQHLGFPALATTQALVEQSIEPAVADVFDTNAVKAVVSRAQAEVVIEQLTALPRTPPVSQ